MAADNDLVLRNERRPLLFIVKLCTNEDHEHIAAMAALERRVLCEQLGTSSTLQDDLAARRTVLCAIHRSSTKVLGFLVYTCNSVNVHINKLLTAPDTRRCGVASALLKVCLTTVVAQRKLQSSSLYVSTANIPAIALYTKAGYTIDGLLKDHYGLHQDAYRMICELQQSAPMQAFLQADICLHRHLD